MTGLARRGYTVVELMMALAVLGIGVSGIIAMQKVTLTANQHAKNLAIATHIAVAWQEQLAADAVSWNHPSERNTNADIGFDTTWLRSVVTNEGAWIQPPYSATRVFGPAFDALGDPLELPGDLPRARFCTHLRLSWLYPQATGNGLVRAEVRVFWRRVGVADTTPFCTGAEDTVSIGQAIETYHFVYKATAVRQNPPTG
jgi:prepilin-type N-terminal cleavage/methylation domain-containing protein